MCLQLYLTTTPDHLEECLSLTGHLAHVAFCIGGDGALLCRPLPETLRGGLLVLRQEGAFPAQAAVALSREVLRLCLRRSFSGVVLDLPPTLCAGSLALARQLEDLCPCYGRKLYVPPACAEAAPHGQVLVCTALSGGSLAELLTEACSRYGPERIALDLQRLMMEFPLPCPSGVGTPLTVQELRQRRQGRSVYYCDGLCARYFTRQQGGETRFILFDDADTMHRKIVLAAGMGIGEGFFMWPEVADIAGALFEKKKEGEP